MKSVLSLAALALACFGLIHTAHAGEIKNTQDVLGGALTRAGVKNQDQLSDSQLKELCEDGYSAAFFLYSGAKSRTIKCSRGSITYSSQKWTSTRPILEAISDAIGDGTRVFVHCNNGAHASGYVAAIALRQFCGMSGADAFEYWKDHTDGYGDNPPARGKIKAGIEGYDPVGGMNHARCN